MIDPSGAAKKPGLTYSNFMQTCIDPFLKWMAKHTNDADKHVFDFIHVQKVAHVVSIASQRVNSSSKFTKTKVDHLFYRNGICDLIEIAKGTAIGAEIIPDSLTKKSSCKTGKEHKINLNLVEAVCTLFDDLDTSSVVAQAQELAVAAFQHASREIPRVHLTVATDNSEGDDRRAAANILISIGRQDTDLDPSQTEPKEGDTHTPEEDQGE